MLAFARGTGSVSAAPPERVTLTCSLPATNGSLKYMVTSGGLLVRRAPAGGSELIRNECAAAIAGVASAIAATGTATEMSRLGREKVRISYQGIVGRSSNGG